MRTSAPKGASSDIAPRGSGEDRASASITPAAPPSASPNGGPSPSRDELLEGLRRVGLNRYESAVYLGLVTDQNAKVAEISKRTGVPQPKVYQALDALVEKGFCAFGSDAVNRYRPIPPAVALEAYVRELKERESAATELAGDLDELLRAGSGQSLWAPPIEVVKGMGQIKRTLVDGIAAARSEILSFGKGPQIPAIEVGRALFEAAERGVDVKLVHEPGYFDSETSEPAENDLYQRMKGARRVYEVPTKMMIVDRQTAMVKITRVEDEGHMILLLRHPGLVAHFIASFDHAWDRAATSD